MLKVASYASGVEGYSDSESQGLTDNQKGLIDSILTGEERKGVTASSIISYIREKQREAAKVERERKEAERNRVITEFFSDYKSKTTEIKEAADATLALALKPDVTKEDRKAISDNVNVISEFLSNFSDFLSGRNISTYYGDIDADEVYTETESY